MGLFFVLAIIIFLTAALANLYFSIRIFKHKKRYFFMLGAGIFSSFPLIKLCFVLKTRKGFNIALVKKKGRLHGFSRDAAPKINRAFVTDILRCTKIITLDTDISLGLDEAKNTAILCGMISSLLDFISNKFVKDPGNSKYRVAPVYDSVVFTIKLHCIFKLNLAKSIIVYLKNEIKRRCKKNESYSGSYADNDG